MDETQPTPTWHDVDPPRALTAPEQGVVDVLVAAFGLPALRTQASEVRVSGRCACGCSSVRLTTTADAVRAADLVRAGSLDDGFHLAVEARAGRGRSARQVVLHVLQGRLHDLEVFVAEGVAVPLPQPRHLRGITVTR